MQIRPNPDFNGGYLLGSQEVAFIQYVDPKLRVIGVEGLRVADASEMPLLTSGNTNAPTIMNGARAAAFIQDSL